MKILITYLSQTGNTAKIGNEICKIVSHYGNVVIRNIEKIKADELNKYDLVFIGSPCHAGGLSNQVKKFMMSIPEKRSYKLAGFITHASSVFSKSDYIESMTTFEDICQSKMIELLGIFECQGFLKPEIHEFVKKQKKLSDKEWTARVESMKGHPNTEDLENAQKFAKVIINKILCSISR